jgi:hypothetical protein
MVLSELEVQTEAILFQERLKTYQDLETIQMIARPLEKMDKSSPLALDIT